VGAADVVPFVPIAGVTLAECAVIAARAGEQMWRRLRSRFSIRRGSHARRSGGIGKCASRSAHHPDMHPDFGEGALHPTAGATVVGRAIF
jgi:glutamate formiminotransferase